jgi:chromate reductase, NAD(P)H dehydrogenase (quinone)
MITIISGTNRLQSNTRKIALIYNGIFEQFGERVQFLDLEWMNSTIRTEEFSKIEAEILIPTTKFVIISPEYNGSFSGVLKLLIDISDVKNVWHNKKAMLVGVASGRAGNLRGMDNLTNILNHLKVEVFSNKVPISSVQNELDENGNLINDDMKFLLEMQSKAFITF